MPSIIDRRASQPSHNFEGGNPKRLLGFDGTTYFHKIDAKYVTHDTMPRSLIGAQTVHFDEKSGMLYYLETTTNGPNMRPGVGFNMRTGEYLSLESRQEKKDPKNDPRIKNALGLLGHKYDSWLDNPPGYPEVKELTKRVMKKPTIKFIDLSTAVSAGEYIIFYSNMSHLHACKVSSLEPIRDMGLKGGYRVLSDRNNSSLEIS